MATNNFKAFALDPNANVTSQADWEALPALLSGFTAGKASSAQVNKAIRQASFIAAALAQYTANKSGLDVLDDGDLNGFISKMGTAFGKDFQALDATLSALAGLATGANKLPYFTGNDTAAQTDLTSVGRDIIGKNTIADILTYLDLITNGAVGRLMGPPKRFTSSGTYTPTAGTKFIIVEQVGGGGGGGGVPATSSTAYTASAGGGAGAYASGIFTSGFSGVTVTIGAGGTGGPAGANTGGNGGTTSFGSLLIAPGGVGGGPGVAGMTTPHMVPNGGSSAEPTGANIVGFAGVASTTAFAYTIGNIIGSSGASCPFGTGGWQPSASGFRSGSGFGSGASGSNQGPSLAAAAGGSGQPGVVIVWEYA
ncbi:hypothetical protein ITZ08_003410 [Escherichia coli]|nr:hypothetical protein [Escherichia coli]